MQRCLEALYVADPVDQLSRIEEKWGKRYHCDVKLSSFKAYFYEWQNDPNDRILWLTDSSRIGQGLVMSGIVKELVEIGSPLAVCVCESKRDTDVVYVFRSLIWMLANTHRQLGRYLEDLDTPGKRLAVNLLDIQRLSSVLSNILQDATMSTMHLFIDQEHNCVDQGGLLQEFIWESACDPKSRAKWILTGDSRSQNAWVQTNLATEVNLDRFTQPPETTPFKTLALENVNAGKWSFYRIRGFSQSYGLDQATYVIKSMLSAEEQRQANLHTSLVPTCDDGSTSQTVILSSNSPLAFLKSLDDNFVGCHSVDTIAGKLSFDRYFEGLTQIYANPSDKVIIAE